VKTTSAFCIFDVTPRPWRHNGLSPLTGLAFLAIDGQQYAGYGDSVLGRSAMASIGLLHKEQDVDLGAADPRVFWRPMVRRNRLGNTAIEVSELSFGTLPFAKRHSNLSVKEGARVLKRGFERGINLVDTGASYGTQAHVREGLRGVGDAVVISTKTHATTRDRAREDFETGLRELDREYIDIYQLHLVHNAAHLADRRDVLEFLLECKETGLIRAIGASVHTIAGARAVVAEPDIDVLFALLNTRGMGISDGTVYDMIHVCRQADARGMGVLAMKPLGGGNLRKSAKEAFDFLRHLGILDSICVGMKSPAEVEMNVSLFEGREVSSEILAQIETIPRRLRISRKSCIGCGACVETCAQEALSIDFSQADPSEGKEGRAVVDQDKCILCGYCADACAQFAIRVV